MGHSQIETASDNRLTQAISPAFPQCVYLDRNQATDWLATHGTHPLAVISFAGPVPDGFPCPAIGLNLPELMEPSKLELWTTSAPVQTYRDREFSATACGEYLFGSVTFEELPGQSLDRVTEVAYRQLLNRLRDLAYPHLCRMWNYFPKINDHVNGLERYQAFCLGRHSALADLLPGFPHSLPAGTAVGTRSGPLQIYFIAGARTSTHLGNPRQLHAYEYPELYGPRSPSFARATLCQSTTCSTLFISGTASVVGHASRHTGLAQEQTRETVENVTALLHHADSITGDDVQRERSRALFKVYVRNPIDLPMIRRTLHSTSLSSSSDGFLFLQGDLCRRELLVEIEGLITSD